MLSEKECNLFIKNILDWGYKIPDSNGVVRNKTIKRCFDGFGVFVGIPVYWESKYFPEAKKTISHNDLFGRKHQVENMIEIYSHFSPHAINELSINCLILYCIFMRVSARTIKLIIIRNDDLRELYLSKQTSYPIQELIVKGKGEITLSTNLGKEKKTLWDILIPKKKGEGK